MDPDIEPEPVEELLGSLEGQVLLLFDEPAYEVRQAAVGERDVTGAFEDDDVGAASRRRRRVAVDMPPATPPTITTFLGDWVVSGVPAIIISSRPHLRENQGLRSVAQFWCLLGPAVATLRGRHMAEHLLDVGTASLPGWPATVSTRNGSTHTP